ncbi:hypothetical protein HK097_010777 [Rhizophlyctis rosea]|uniref:2Fe-2S ferredoxin-type domain-containing protein n=1 Tax=Rhizophlyctis rosea TaxID=64517 RepID=A0AAD5X7Y1_9FUNG|nr:hypothetical protein HK097_010777 [Rhizophlyctis rosea]
MLRRVYPHFIKNFLSSRSSTPFLAPSTSTLRLTSQARSLFQTPALQHKVLDKPAAGEGLQVTYITPDNEKITITAREGDNLLDLAHNNDIELEGACEGSLACSTCHVIVDPEFYDHIPEPTDEENDMLDLAFGLTETSRLGCQVCMTKELNGITVRIPSMTRNVQQEKLK